MLHNSRKQCVICETALDVHQAVRSQLCKSVGCAQQFASRMARQKTMRADRGRHLATNRAFSTARSLMKTGKLAPRGNFDVAPVPALTNPLGPPSPQRQQSYREHLENLLEQWEAEGGNPVAADLETEQEDSEKELFSHACATCRGKCCQPGGTHAFHDIVTIRRWFAVNPEAGVQQCMQDFLSRLAPISYSGSCVFHGPGGCELPRAMRSDTCNTWLCTELVDLQSSRPERSRQITLIIASDRNIVHRISVVNTRSGEKLETLDCEDLPIRHTKND